MNAFNSTGGSQPVHSFRAQPRLVETVRSSEAQDDQTAVVQLRDSDPDLVEQTCSVFERMQPELIHTHQLEELETVGHAAQACGKPVIVCTPTPEEALCPRSSRLIPTDYQPTLLHNICRSLVFANPATPRAFLLQNWDISVTLDRYVDFSGVSSAVANAVAI